MSPTAMPLSIPVGAGYGSNLVSLFLATGAFLVAVIGLYLTNLRRARIDLMPLGGRHRLSASGTVVGGAGDKVLSDSASLWLSIVAFNSGARAGALLSVRVEEIREVPADPRLFESVSFPLEILWPPEGFEAGDVHLLDLSPIGFRPVVQAGNDRSEAALLKVWDELVAIADPKTRIDVRLSWRYFRGRRWFWHRQRLPERTGRISISVPMDAYLRALRNRA